MKKPNLFYLSLKKIGRTIARSPLQFLAMTVILTLASTLFTGFYASAESVNQRVNKIYKDGNVADLWVTTDSDPSKNDVNRDKQDVINAVDTFGGKVESRFQSDGKMQSFDYRLTLYDEMPTISKYAEVKEEQDSHDFYIIDGRVIDSPTEGYGKRSDWLNEDGSYKETEVSITNFYLQDYLNSHSSVTNYLNEHLKDGAKNIFTNKQLLIKMTPTGRMKHPESVLISTSVPPVIMISRSFILNNLIKLINDNFNDWTPSTDPDEIFAHNLVTNPKEAIINEYWKDNQYVVKLDKHKDTINAQRAIEAKFTARSDEENDLLTSVSLEGSQFYQYMQSEIIQTKQLSYVFPSIFFLVAILVVLTTFSQVILKERNEIGTLKALGVSTKAIIFYYLGLAMLVSLVGIILGLVIGPLTFPMLFGYKIDLLYFLPARSYIFPTLPAILLSVTIILLVSLITFLVIKKVASEAPSISMRPKISAQLKNHYKPITPNKKHKTFRLCSRMAFRNIFSKPARSLMVIIGVLGCTGLLASGFGVDDSVNASVAHDINGYFNADAQLMFSNPTEQTVDGLKALRDEGTLDAAEAFGMFPCVCTKRGYSNTTYTTNVYAIDTLAEMNFKFFDMGKFVPHRDIIAISKKAANALNLKVGDYTYFDALGHRYYAQVGAIINNFYLQGYFVDGTWPDFPTVKNYPTTAYVRFNKKLDQEEIINQIKAIDGIGKVTDRKNLVGIIDKAVSSIKAITLIIKVFAILLCMVVLYNLALLNYNENIRNTATMKVLGFTRKEIALSLFIEISVLSLVGIVIGLSIGLPLVIAILSVNNTPISEFTYVMFFPSYMYALLITIGVSILVNIYIGLKNKKVKMVESLKAIE